MGGDDVDPASLPHDLYRRRSAANADADGSRLPPAPSTSTNAPSLSPLPEQGQDPLGRPGFPPRGGLDVRPRRRDPQPPQHPLAEDAPIVNLARGRVGRLEGGDGVAASPAAAAAAEELGLGPEEARDLRGEDGVGEVSGEVAARAGERDGVDLGGGGEEFFFFSPAEVEVEVWERKRVEREGIEKRFFVFFRRRFRRFCGRLLARS